MTLSPRFYAAALAVAACSNNSAQRATMTASPLPPTPVAVAPVALTDPECRVDDDCRPTTCCGPTAPDTCTTRANAPAHCGAVECSRVPTLRCACRAGRCAGVP